jgi:hypothetical protein
MSKARFRQINPRPVRPGTLAVRQDWTRTKGTRWAIVSPEPIHSRHGLMGHQRGYGQAHAGLWVYPFIKRDTALRAAQRIMASGHSVWAAR